MSDVSHKEKHYDYLVVGAGSAGSVLAAELSTSGAQVLVIESGGPDDAPTLMNPSIWFYNVGGPLDYQLPIRPSPQLNNRNLKMPLGHVFGGSSINAMVWTRGMPRDFDGWAKSGAKGWSFADGFRFSRSKRTGKAAPMPGGESAARYTSAAPRILIPQRPPSLKPLETFCAQRRRAISQFALKFLL
jgi:choline dehydrogenase-like flavoprotein